MALVSVLARRRVPLGFAAAAAALLLSDPTWDSWRLGLGVAAVGELVRIWAAGHLEKSREVTRSGPYRWTRHPLYVGSSIVALGVVIATRSWMVAALTAVYMVTTISAAIATEEAYLRQAFGETYDRYARRQAEPMLRRFSLARAFRNREYRAVLGVLVGFALLAARVLL